ncbi:spermatogenesis-associated protein 33 [Physeter macrocephalus]|uniref:Spermatogenesis-associated protein 33 n=1 Tax=Physeter macrocephalus TaxID=9755 RepID=A0A2Y9FKA3_PHYMC|nr:spermatogenesis-associated protein 33 [Physeter catodon]|eukprot:XP_007125564.3 spermatogenesis-associated protein 33 [Physeter catodon]
MAGPAAAALAEADGLDLPAASTKPTGAGWRTGGRVTAGSPPLPAAGSSRERTGWSRGRWRCRGDRAGPGGGGRASCEEPKSGRTCSVPEATERPVDRPSQESEKPPDTKPAESFHEKKGAAKRQWPSSEVEEEFFHRLMKYPAVFLLLEKPDVNSEKKKFAVPQIVVTTASKETLISYGSAGMEEQRTIRESAEPGPFYRHRSPSTADAYNSQAKE